MLRNQYQVLIGIILIVLVGLGAIVAQTYQSLSNDVLSDFRQQMSEKKSVLNISLANSVKDLLVASKTLSSFRCIAECQNRHVDEYVAFFLTTHKHFTQFRLLNLAGQEILRWDYSKASNRVDRITNLQDKSSRYYFQESKNMRIGEIYISSFDYNVENNQIELPVVPTVRVVSKTLISDSEYLVVGNIDLSRVIDTDVRDHADADADAVPYLNLIVANRTDIDGDGVVDEILPLMSSSQVVSDLTVISDHPLKAKLQGIDLKTEDSQQHATETGYVMVQTERIAPTPDFPQERHFTLAAWVPDKYILSMYSREYGQLMLFLTVLASVLIWLVWRSLKVSTQLRVHQRELQDRAEKQSRLFSVIGHELRTPIASMKMMEHDMSLQEMKPHGAAICETTDSLLAILDDLRLVARPERVKETEIVVDAPYLVVERALNSVLYLFGKHGIEAHYSANSEANQKARFSAQSFGQIVTNLLKNAAVHSGATDVWVDLHCERELDGHRSVVVTIQDNGAGIDTEKQKLMFEAFVRGQSDADGTGLGLYIVKHLSQNLGGDAEYFASPKGGAGFKITFNVETQVTPVQEESSNELPLTGLKILFAEDQLTLQKLTCKQLELNRAEVIGVLDGVEALKAMNGREFDIVLTDINMPNMNGYELTTALRERGFGGFIIGVTAATIGSETDKLISLGANAVLQKPINLSELRKLLFELTARQDNGES